MIYPKSPFCPMNDGNPEGNSGSGSGKGRMQDNNNMNNGNAMDSNANDGAPDGRQNNRGNNDGSNRNIPLWPDDMNKRNCGSENLSRDELMNILRELTFAVTDLNLFLDTHPDEEEALKTFTMLSAALRSYRHDYTAKFGPLYATDSSDETPFDWVSSEHKWPWQL